MLAKKIENLILCQLKDSRVYVTTFDDIHFDIVIIDDIFIGFSLVERHRYVYNIIKEYILNKVIHAVSMKIYTLKEWENHS